MSTFTTTEQTTFGDAPIFVFCDHATNAIPPEYGGLGLPDDILATHIAFDLGAGPLAIDLTKRLDGVLLASTFSRLLVDPNRSPDRLDFIPLLSDQIPIPGNQGLTEKGRTQRIDAFFKPYHEELAAALDSFQARHETPFIVSVHSFSPKLMGETTPRPWEISLLWREDEASAKALISWLEENTDYCVGDNEPYDGRVFNYTVDRHVSPRALPHITFEIRQDLLSNEQEAAKMADILAKAIHAVLARQRPLKEPVDDSRPDARR